MVRKTQAGDISKKPGVRVTSLGENYSPKQTFNNASIATNAKAYFEAKACSTQPVVFQKRIFEGKALKPAKLDATMHEITSKYGMSVTPTWDH